MTKICLAILYFICTIPSLGENTNIAESISKSNIVRIYIMPNRYFVLAIRREDLREIAYRKIELKCRGNCELTQTNFVNLLRQALPVRNSSCPSGDYRALVVFQRSPPPLLEPEFIEVAFDNTYQCLEVNGKTYYSAKSFEPLFDRMLTFD